MWEGYYLYIRICRCSCRCPCSYIFHQLCSSHRNTYDDDDAQNENDDDDAQNENDDDDVNGQVAKDAVGLNFQRTLWDPYFWALALDPLL